jgi:hypothetical protein
MHFKVAGHCSSSTNHQQQYGLAAKLTSYVVGMGKPGERFVIVCSWKDAVDSVTAFNSGKWKAKISTPAAGGSLYHYYQKQV